MFGIGKKLACVLMLCLPLLTQGAWAAGDMQTRSRAAIAAWMGHAQRNEPGEMLKYTQTAWLKTRRNAAGLLDAWYGKNTAPIRIVSWRITGEDAGVIPGASRFFHVEALIDGPLGRVTSKARAHVVCEREPYEPASDGRCGVNPESAFFR